MKGQNYISKVSCDNIIRFSVFAALYLKIVWMVISAVYLFYPVRIYVIWAAVAIIIDIILLCLYCIYILRLKVFTLMVVTVSIIIFLPMIISTIEFK